MENFILCDNEGLQVGLDLGLKPGENVIYNMVDGKPVVIARKFDGGDWKLEGDVYPAYVDEIRHSFDHVDGHRSLVKCVFETNNVFDFSKLPVIKVSPVAFAVQQETVELGTMEVKNGHEVDTERLIQDGNMPDGKWKITATRVG